MYNGQLLCSEREWRFSDEPDSQPYPSPELAMIYPGTANFIIVAGVQKYESFNNRVKSLMAEEANIDVQVVSFPSDNGLAGLSDQSNYWHLGYPALMINDTSFVRNPHYHQNTDTIETLDYDKMTEVVNGAYNAIVKIA